METVLSSVTVRAALGVELAEGRRRAPGRGLLWGGAGARGERGGAHLRRAGGGGTAEGRAHPEALPSERPAPWLLWKPEAGEVGLLGLWSPGEAWRSVPAPQTPGRELRHSAGGHGCPVAATTSPSGAPPGAAATAPERAGSGSRFPAALGVPGTRLLPAGETPPPRSRGAGAAGMLRAGRGSGGAEGRPGGRGSRLARGGQEVRAGVSEAVRGLGTRSGRPG